MKKRVRDKRGFTLIELLVVIALMLSILGIAVVSFVGISNKKKESSKELIKEQIETAALEYFNANEFLFSNLKDDAFGVISVGKLVNDDYLNVVTNPVTGKKIGNCTIVVVKRKNNKFTSDVDDESFENATDNKTGSQLTNVCDSILVSSDDIQGGKITYYDENYKKLTGKRFKDLSDNKKLWFNSKHLGENKNLIACSEDEVEVKKSKGDEIEVIKKEGLGYCATIKNGTNEDITYSSKDGSWSLTVAERVDTTPPLVSNLKVESENSYVVRRALSDIKEYREKFYSFKLIPGMKKIKNLYAYSDEEAIKKRTCKNNGTRCFNFDNGDSYDAVDMDADGKSMLLRSAPKGYESFNYGIINEIFSLLDNNGLHIVQYMSKSDLPSDVNNYYIHYNQGIFYDKNGTQDGVKVYNEHIVDGETRKVSSRKYYVYYTKRNLLCVINRSVYNSSENDCVRVEDIYPKTLNISTYGIFLSLDRTIPHYSSVYDKIANITASAYANYGREINGQLTKVSFDYKDETSKVYSYGINKKYVKKVKRDEKYGDLISYYLKQTLTDLNSLVWIKNYRDLYNFSYTIDKKSALKDEGLNEEYNKEVLNSVEINDLKQTEEDYTKTKINKNGDNVTLEHIYADGELDGSIDKYNLNIKDNAGNGVISEANYEKYKNCTYKNQEFFEGHVAEQSCEDVCNKHGTLVEKKGSGVLVYVDEATGEFCSKPEFFGEDEVRTPNSPECPWTDCPVTTTKKTTKNQTTKPSKTTSTTKACDWGKVKISFSVSNANKDHCYAVGESVTREKNATSFTVGFDYPSDFKKIATHAAFCKDAKTCKNITTSNKNQTSVVCTNSTNCYENYKYVGASIELECGNTTKTIFDYDSIK